MKMLLKWAMAMTFLIGAIHITSCKKDSNTGAAPSSDKEQQIATASDETEATAESEEAVMDANIALAKSQFNGRINGQVTDNILGGDVIVDDMHKMLTIKYDGRTLGKCGRLREGIILVKLTNGINWSDKGSEITITFQGFKSKKSCGGKMRSIEFDGSTTITNVTGGLFSHMVPGDSVVYEIKGSSEITFESGKIATWNIARRMTFTMHADLVKRIAVDGIGPDDDVIWGTDRHGRDFEVAITQTIRRNSKCGYDEATAGIKVYRKLPKEITLTFGVDKEGNPVTAQDCSAYGYKISWINPEGKAIFYVNPYDED